MLSRHVLVLNQNYEPLCVCNARRAIVLVYLGKAEIVERYDGLLVRSMTLSYPLPSVVRLVFYVKALRREVPLSRKNIIRRDRHQCQYCGRTTGPMTTDHVIPRTMNGEDTWENLVCACVECNNKKGNRTPEQASMRLIRRPTVPHFFVFVHYFITIPDDKWRQYLFLGDASAAHMASDVDDETFRRMAGCRPH
jgi:5-methylcytosine-specific restriction endonuclease McrA